MTVIRQTLLKSAKMQAIVNTFDDYEKKKAWNMVFMNLQNNSEQQTQDEGLTFDVAVREQNQVKNRYCNVIPYDQNLLELPSPKNFYINASPMKADITGRDYIFAQGPLEDTSSDFWHMVYTKESNIIVMLTDCTEFGQKKCHEYFPTKNDKNKKFGNYFVELLNEESNEWYIIRKLKLTPNKGTSTESHTVHHFQFTNWADFGVPDSNNFIDFVEAVRNLDDSLNTHTPIVCHCSAGIGRTGTFVVADILLTALRRGNTEDLPMIDELILQMRKYRMWLVQTPAQLRFSWKAVVDWIRREDILANEQPEEPTEEAIDDEECESDSCMSEEEEPSSGKLPFSPGKRTSTDDDMVKLNERRQKIQSMRSKLNRVEERKVRREYWYHQLPYIVGSAAFIGLASLIIYRYVGSGEPQNYNLS